MPFRIPLQILFVGLLVAYLASRLTGALYFVPHNDEVIYTEVAMLIEENWEQHKYHSVNGDMYYDYKEPLPFWLTSLTVKLFPNPLIGMRLWSVACGLLGLIFTYWLVVRIWNPQAALLACLGIGLSEYFLYFDSIALHEAYLYGLGAVFLYGLYDFLETRHWFSGVLAILSFTAMLTTKTSGQMWAVLALWIPLAILTQPYLATTPLTKRWMRCLLGYVWILAIMALAEGLHRLIIPSEFDSVKEASYQLGLVRTSSELLAFPWSEWWASIQFYGLRLLPLELGWFAVPALLLMGFTALGMGWQRHSGFWQYLVWLGLFLASFGPLSLVAKSTTIRYFGMGLYFFYIPLAVALVWAGSWFPKKVRFAGVMVIAILGIGWKAWNSGTDVVRWGQTPLALKEMPPAPGNGAGIFELVQKLSQLDSGDLYVDTQWGNPATAIKVFHAYYPDLTIREFTQAQMISLSVQTQEGRRTNRNIYLALDTALGNPVQRAALLKDPFFCSQKYEFPKQYRGETFPQSQLVLCQVGNP